MPICPVCDFPYIFSTCDCQIGRGMPATTEHITLLRVKRLADGGPVRGGSNRHVAGTLALIVSQLPKTKPG